MSNPYAYINTSGSSTVTVVDMGSKRVIKTLDVGCPEGVLALTPDKNHLYAASDKGEDRFVSVVNTSDWTVAEVDISLGMRMKPRSMAAPDNQTVYVAVNDPNNSNGVQTRSAICAIATSTNKVIAQIDLSIAGPPVNNWPSPQGGMGGVGQIAINSGKLYATVMGANKIAVIDTASHRVIDTILAGSGPGLTFAPDGLRFYTINTYNLGIRYWDTSADVMSSSQILPPSGDCGGPQSLVVAPNNQWLYVLCGDTYCVYRIDYDPVYYTHKNVGKIVLPANFRASAIAVNAQELWVVGSPKPSALVFKTSDNSLITTIPLPGGGPDCIVLGQ